MIIYIDMKNMCKIFDTDPHLVENFWHEFETSPLPPRKHSEETKKMISESLMGRKRPPEYCEKMRQKALNISDETRAKMSKANKGRTAWNKGLKHPGRVLSEAHKQNLRKPKPEASRENYRIAARKRVERKRNGE